MQTTIIAGVTIAVLSLITQKTLSNLLYGFTVCISRQFKKGDKVIIRHWGSEIASGRIVSIGPLHVRVQGYNRDIQIVPNAFLEDCVVINSDYKDGVNHTERIKVTFDSDTKQAILAIKNAVILHKRTGNTEENTHIICKNVDGGLVLEYNIRTDDVDSSFDVCSEIAMKIAKELAKNNAVTLI